MNIKELVNLCSKGIQLRISLALSSCFCPFPPPLFLSLYSLSYLFLSICLSFCLCNCPPVSVAIPISPYLSPCLYVCLCFYSCLLICPPVFLSVSVRVSLYLCQYVSVSASHLLTLTVRGSCLCLHIPVFFLKPEAEVKTQDFTPLTILSYVHTKHWPSRKRVYSRLASSWSGAQTRLGR